MVKSVIRCDWSWDCVKSKLIITLLGFLFLTYVEAIYLLIVMLQQTPPQVLAHIGYYIASFFAGMVLLYLLLKVT